MESLCYSDLLRPFYGLVGACFVTYMHLIGCHTDAMSSTFFSHDIYTHKILKGFVDILYNYSTWSRNRRNGSIDCFNAFCVLCIRELLSKCEFRASLFWYRSVKKTVILGYRLAPHFSIHIAAPETRILQIYLNYVHSLAFS